MSTETILDTDFNAVADSNGNISFSDETLEAPEKYMVAVANVRGNLSWSSASTLGEWVDPDEPDQPDGPDEPVIVETPSVLNFKAEMVNSTTIRISWDKPSLASDGFGEIDKHLYEVMSIRFSTNETEWTTLYSKDVDISVPRETVMIDGTVRMSATVKYRMILPNVTHYVQITTYGNSSWSNSDQIWWLDAHKWLSHQWGESEIVRNESPLFLAHIYRLRSASEVAILVSLRTGDFLSDTLQELLVNALSEYNYNTDIFDTVVIDTLGDTTIGAYQLLSGTATTNAAYAVLDVLSEDDLFVYPDPSTDITSVTWSIEQAAGGFNKHPTPLAGFDSIQVPAGKCLLEQPFKDRFSIGHDNRGYNFHLEPGCQTIGGSSIHPFSTAGNYIFKVVITPTSGNPVVLTYNVAVSV